MTQRSGLGLVPMVAWVAGAVVFLAISGAFILFFGDGGAPWFAVALGSGMGALMAAAIVLSGYVYGDAKRRGMPALPWAALALFAPNLLGFLLYFLLRKPIAHPCPSCGRDVSSDAAFCPACGQPQATVAVPQPGSAS